MMGLRNMYKVFNESRKAARKEATLGVTGDSARADAVANLLGAQRGSRGAEIILYVPESGRLTLSGKAVDEPDDLDLSSVTEEAVRDQLATRLVRALEEEHLIQFGRGYPIFRRAVCDEIIRKNARQNAVVGALPIPGADMPVMTANQGRMVLGIAAVYGEDLSLDRVRELLGVLAAGFGLRALSRQVVKLVPFGGWVASAAIGYAGTVTMGRATMLYFERGGQQVGQKEMEQIRTRAAEEAKTFVSRMRRR